MERECPHQAGKLSESFFRTVSKCDKPSVYKSIAMQNGGIEKD